MSFQNSKADDIYDLGSLIYYTLTKGHGCFSTTKKKQYFQKQRVGMAKKIPWFIQDDLDCSAASTEQKITSMNLIIQMVTQEPNHRLTIDKVLYHPAFYSPELKLQFLLTVYESLKKFYSDSENPLACKIDEINIQFDPKKDFKGRPYFFESSQNNKAKNDGWEILATLAMCMLYLKLYAIRLPIAVMENLEMCLVSLRLILK